MIDKLGNLKDYSSYLPHDIAKKTRVEPAYWELQNRKSFYQWLDTHFAKYNQGDSNARNKTDKEEIQPNMDRIIKQLAPIQKLVRDFMAGPSPYRGLLVFYGLGVGKTQTSISISDAIQNRSEVIFMSKAALEPNFIEGVKKGGADYMVTSNYWVFLKKNDTNEFNKLIKEIGVPMKIVNDAGGVYVIDYTKKTSNYDKLTTEERDELNIQINAIIKSRFKFMHYDDTRLIKKLEEQEENPFNNKVVIVDEVHNLINGMTKEKSSTAKFYNMFMDAENVKFVFLTGTPIINKVYEASKLFNILRGKIHYVEFKFKFVFSADINYRKIKSELLKNRQIDQVIVNKINKTVKITFNPDGYLTSIDPDKKGIIYQPNSPALLSRDDIIKNAINVLTSLGYKFDKSVGYETALPNNEIEFNQYFYNAELNKIKKKELFKKRIANLTSFYDYKDPEQFPSIKRTNIIQVPMSMYQLGKYSTVRIEEIKNDKNSQKRGGNNDEQLYSSYRLHSRLACSIVEPDDIPSMVDFRDKKKDIREDIIEKIRKEYGEDIDELDDKMVDEFFKKYVLGKLDKEKKRYFSLESMQVICPKYSEIIKRLQSNTGLSLIYSYFITFKGLKTLSLAMEATDEWEPLLIKKIDGMWQLDNKMDKKHATTKRRFIFYSGQQSREEKELLPKIFNSQYHLLPDNCNKLREQLFEYYGKNNYRGAAVACLMTTKTGAEGLDLKNIRTVHITEPYWQPVLTQQVIGRAVRKNSHLDLPLDERNVEINIYMSTIPKTMYSDLNVGIRQDTARYNDGLGMKGQVVTSDEALYITSKRKEAITAELLNMIKDTAFDCNLNYANNKRQHKEIVCMDYETTDRDEYLFTPHLDDTLDIINIKQDYYVTTNYTKFKYQGKDYYFNTEATNDGNYYIYDSSVIEKTRTPKPIGKMVIHNGRQVPAFYKKRTSLRTSKRISGLSKNKTHTVKRK